MTSALAPEPFARGIPCSCSRPPSPGVRTIKTFGAPGPVANHRDLVAPPHLPGGKPGSGLPPGRDFSIGSTWAGPPGVLPCEFQLFTRSSTKRPPPWTEPGSSCPRIWPAPNASPPNEGRTRGMTDLRMSRGRLRGSAGAGHPISPSPRTLALAGREPGRLRNPSLAEHGQRKEETSQDQERLSAGSNGRVLIA